MKLNKNSKFGTVGLSSFFALCAVLGVAVACPSANMSASAAESQSLTIDFSLTNEAAIKNALLQIDFFLENSAASVMSKMLTIDFFLENGNPDYQAIFKVLGIDFLLNSNMALSMSGPDSVVTPTETVQPLPSGQFVSGSTDLSVTTTAQDGFGVYVYSADGETAMVGADAENKIPTLSGTSEVASGSFASNTWGYNLSEAGSTVTAYKGLSATQGSADYTFTGNGTADLRLTFGAKVDMTTAADNYKRDVEVKAAPGAANLATLNEVHTQVKKFIAKSLVENDELRAEVERRQQESGATGDIELANEIVRLTAQR